MKKLWCGVDWATRSHAVCVVDEAGGVRARFDVANTGKTFAGLVKRLIKLHVCGVAIERPDGPFVEALVDAGLLVYVIAPRMLKAVRERYGAAGAKSDPGDAFVLADLLRTDHHRLVPLVADSPETKALRALSRTRTDLVVHRVGLVNQLAAQLMLCFPGAVELFSKLHSSVAIAFLRRYPTTTAATRLTEARLAAFLRRVGYCGRRPVKQLLAQIQQAPAAGIDEAESEARKVCVLALVDAIELCERRVRELEAEITERLEAHRDAAIFTSLPRAGRVRAASLLAEIGDVRQRFPDPESLIALAGAAPVTKASGKHRAVTFRWACDKKLRRATIDFADDSRRASPWAASIYNRARARGCRHPHAVRILARAWLRVIWRCWQDNAAYDPAKHRGAVMLNAA